MWRSRRCSSPAAAQEDAFEDTFMIRIIEAIFELWPYGDSGTSLLGPAAVLGRNKRARPHMFASITVHRKPNSTLHTVSMNVDQSNKRVPLTHGHSKNAPAG